MPCGLGEPGERFCLELADTLAADSQLTGERIVGSLVPRERAGGEDQPAPLISLAEQFSGQPRNMPIGFGWAGQWPEAELGQAAPAAGDVRWHARRGRGEDEQVSEGTRATFGYAPRRDHLQCGGDVRRQGGRGGRQAAARAAGRTSAGGAGRAGRVVLPP